jgi:hypothetical protein
MHYNRESPENLKGSLSSVCKIVVFSKSKGGAKNYFGKYIN